MLMSNVNLSVLRERIESIKSSIDYGFKEIHRRQDVANGRTSKLEIKQDKLEKVQDRMIGGLIVLSAIGIVDILLLLGKFFGISL